MRFAYDEDQEDFRRSLRRFLEAKAPLSSTRREMDSVQGFDRDAWRQLAQLGVQGLLVPEEHGGSGHSFLEAAVVLQEVGYALTSLPVLASSVLATTALVRSGDGEAMARFLPQLAAGELVGTLALCGESGSWDLGQPGVTARQRGEGHVLDGRKGFVLSGQVADLLLVTASTDVGLSLFAVMGDEPSLTRSRLPTVDPTRAQASLELVSTPGVLIGVQGAAAPVLDATVTTGAVALAQEQVGAAQRCLDMMVEYAGTRVQFGRQIGSFQAVKHLCADVLLELESARAAADYAAWATVGAPEELPVVASLAKAFCSDASVLAASQNIQVHGGIGFTWEHDAHLFYKRAISMAEYLGSPRTHREVLAAAVLDGKAA